MFETFFSEYGSIVEFKSLSDKFPLPCVICTCTCTWVMFLYEIATFLKDMK